MQINRMKAVSISLILIFMFPIFSQLNVNQPIENLSNPNEILSSESNNTSSDAWLTLELISWQGNTSTTWDTDGTDIDVQFQVCIDLDGISPQCTWTEVWDNTLNLSNSWQTTFDLIEDNTTLNISIECWDNDDDSDEWNNGPDACDMNPDDDEWRLYYVVNWSTTTTETFSGDGSIGNDTQWGNAESTWKVTVTYYGDEDNDGISDHLDQCSDTHRSFGLDLNGCSWYQLDNDSDGIINDLDNCPNLANEPYCGTDGDYIAVSSITFGYVNHQNFFYLGNNWDISPNGSLIAIALGSPGQYADETIGGLVILSTNAGNDEYKFTDREPVVHMDDHYNARHNTMYTQVKFSSTGEILHYDDGGAAPDPFAYDTENWMRWQEPFPTSSYGLFVTNEGTSVSQASMGSFAISNMDGEQLTVQTRNQYPGVISITGTDDSQSVLIASKDDKGSAAMTTKYALDSSLSIYDLSTGQKKDISLPNLLNHDAYDAWYHGAKISSNGLKIVVHYHVHNNMGDETFLIYERDRDSDGFTDTNDLCPEIAGDILGCAEEYFDTDEDGINDKEDQCPGTTEGTNVDETGCAMNQLDSDGDGISDATDQCPNTPNGDSVGLIGCSSSQVDSDGDGVYDSQDDCPSTPSGVTVDSTGCAPDDVVDLDSDGDGIRDSVDNCPNSATGIIVDSTGCETSGDVQEFEDEVSADDSSNAFYVGLGLLVLAAVAVVGIRSLNSSNIDSYDRDYGTYSSISNQTISAPETEPSLELQNVIAELERQRVQSEREIRQLKQQQAQQSNASEIAAMQQEMRALQQRVADSEQAKLQLQNEIEQVKSQKDESINMQDSVVGGDLIASGGQKIESQTNVMGTDPEVIARIIFEAQEKERERLRRDRDQ